MIDSILKIKNLSVKDKEKLILNNINLEIEKNKITAILGPSGGGKTTLLKCLNRIIEEESSLSITGEIIFNDKNLFDSNLCEIRKDIGMVFQNPTPFPFSIYDNMVYALKYHMPKANLRDIAIENLKRVSLYQEIGENLNMNALKLSGGQKQRLCIGRALTIEPKVLLLDEPCSALDLENTLKIENLLTSLKNNYTIVIVTHNIDQANRIADNTIFINKGTITKSRTI